MMQTTQEKYEADLAEAIERAGGQKPQKHRAFVQDGELIEPHSGKPLLINHNYKVDVDRGCIIRFEPGSGAAIYMYCDEPGRWYNEHAKEVPPQFAAMAGYDTETLLRERRKREALVAAGKAIEAEYAHTGFREVLETRGSYALVHIGDGRYNVEWEDGTPLNAAPVSKEIGERTFRAVSADEPAGTEPPKAPKKG